MNRTYRLFRTLGLRHLCVVNHHNQVRGNGLGGLHRRLLGSDAGSEMPIQNAPGIVENAASPRARGLCGTLLSGRAAALLKSRSTDVLL